MIPVGRISGVYGVRGWVRVYSYTSPRENIVTYKPWYLQQGDNWVEQRLIAGRTQGKGIVAQLEGCDDRDQAMALNGYEIAIREDQFPETEADEYYWRDLEGLQVKNLAGESLGSVDHLLETGANDVLVVKGDRERLIPFVMKQVVLSVDLEQGEIQVDWDKDF